MKRAHHAGFLMLAAGLWSGVAVAADAMQQKVIEENIRPIGTVVVAKPKKAASAAPAQVASASTSAGRSGKQVYDSTCVACHGAGVAGAPKVGDKAAWSARAAQGMKTLLQHATQGFKAMPPKGTCADCTDAELEGAISYMLSQSGVSAGGQGQAPAPSAEAAAPAPAAAAPAGDALKGDAAHGQKIVQSSCFACHGTGAAGAPKIGDKAAWAPRIAQGMKTLLQHATQGFKAMPPKGTCMSCSEQDLLDAITYMVEQSK